MALEDGVNPVGFALTLRVDSDFHLLEIDVHPRHPRKGIGSELLERRPVGLVEETRALQQQPAIPWDVELARWFDGHFAPLEKRRTYAGPSRRQSAMSDTPRPRWYPAEDGRTFGAIIDTSGTMDRKLIGKALGAVASHAINRDVPAIRVVFCDAAVYDQGYVPPDAIARLARSRPRRRKP